MRRIWVKIDPWNKDMVTTALEGGAEALLLPEGYSEKVKALGKITTVAKDGDLKPGEDVVFFDIKSSDDEEEITRLCQSKSVILRCEDWSIIPMENLIAKNADFIAQVENAEEAETAFGILEKGVKSILYHPENPEELKTGLSRLLGEEIQKELTPVKIVDITPVGMGDRVCIDSCTMMSQGEGMLVGNSSAALFLIHSESIENPYVSPRPFRVNAGPVHAYTLVPGGRTRYLSELSAGDPVLIVNHTGATSPGVVGRIKIEKRPLMLLTGEAGDKKVTAIVQNAETIRLVRPDGSPISVVNLSPGDEVMAALEDGGRHFGHKIEETITEK